MTIVPRYDQYKEAWDTSATVEVIYYTFVLCVLDYAILCIISLFGPL